MESFRTMNRLILLNPLVNVFIVSNSIAAGKVVCMNETSFLFEKEIRVGHKLAAKETKACGKIIKYGILIGSATKNILTGEHVNLHSMKSDYIPTYTISKEFGHEK